MCSTVRHFWSFFHFFVGFWFLFIFPLSSPTTIFFNYPIILWNLFSYKMIYIKSSFFLFKFYSYKLMFYVFGCFFFFSNLKLKIQLIFTCVNFISSFVLSRNYFFSWFEILYAKIKSIEECYILFIRFFWLFKFEFSWI